MLWDLGDFLRDWWHFSLRSFCWPCWASVAPRETQRGFCFGAS